jgi:hypothetical protein
MRLEDMFTGIGRANAYYPSLTKVTKSTKATLFLSQLCYWEGKQQDKKNRWIYKSAEEIEEETGLTRREQEGARRILKELGILEEMYARTPRTLHYRINFEVLEQLWNKYQEEEAMHQNAQLISQDGESMHQMSNLHSTNCRNYIRPNVETNTEITTEITQEITDGDSLRSSLSLEKPSKHLANTSEDMLPDSLEGSVEKEINDIGAEALLEKKVIDDIVKTAAEKSREARESKERKPRKRSQNANTIIEYFNDQFKKTFGGVAPLELEKDRKLMKQMIEHYGYDMSVAMIEWLFRNWAKFRRECKVNGVPTVGLVFGFRSYLQEKVMHIVDEHDNVGEGDSVWGV